MNIICLLSVKPCAKTYEFFRDLKKQSAYEVIIVIDDNKHEIPGYDGIVPLIKMDPTICEKVGFKSCIQWLNNKAVSRDKALYYFNHVYDKPYENIWFVEEDVFIPSVKTIQNMDAKYPTGDLIAASNNIYYDKPTDWHWNLVYSQVQIPPPYGNSMICAIRCSKKLVNCIGDYAAKYNNLFMDEALFNTIAIHNNLEIKAVPELSPIVYRHIWKLSDISPEKLYHPIKDIRVQYYYRQQLVNVTGTS